MICTIRRARQRFTMQLQKKLCRIYGEELERDNYIEAVADKYHDRYRRSAEAGQPAMVQRSAWRQVEHLLCVKDQELRREQGSEKKKENGMIAVTEAAFDLADRTYRTVS